MKTNLLHDYQSTTDQVLALCELHPEDMASIQFEGAMICLDKVLQSDAHGITELPKTPAFWMWWREQWYRRDLAFIEALSFDTGLMKYTCALPGTRVRVVINGTASLCDMYLRYHRMAADNPLVNNTSLEVSFHCMLKELGPNK
jgi:hypothetical protein